ncbi:hypothetical protein HNY73_000272 [Argiope bruennichi]|uniref:Spaetzle domain-containing protein n=1 Tax=Argiope bruennichi TaxID=94029 RepID=A0A8T0FXK4_ARGBR|nr:hypothetical protein HNY73_000272 [Argiope bruennichi]
MGVLKTLEQGVYIYLLIISLCNIGVIVGDVLRGEKEGYYAFEEAPSRFMRPPQVRKPPYMMSTVPCQTGGSSKRPSPKYTLCGDLNKGFIPLNPLGQEFNGQPYPFELIKNKTLVFLSKALPYLKEDPKIPKVSKSLPRKKPTYAATNPNFPHYLATKTPLASKGIANESTNGTTEDILLDILDNETTARQNCDQGGASGLLCTLSSVMSNNKIPLALISAVAQSFASSMTPSTPAPQEYTTERPVSYHAQESSDSGGSGSNGGGSMTDAIISLLGTLAQMGLGDKGPGSTKDSSLSEEEPSTLAHVMSVLTGASPGSGSPLSLVLKLMTSEASPLKALTGGFPSRKRRPVGEDLMAAESNVRKPQENYLDLPPTPCPSSEEYVTPTFARNYQGVWKYVVQIPQEGYFTQTVQQTKCMRNRCDFMDGICHESPRWVSLLVAETYYPDSFIPAASTAPPPPPPVEDFYNFQQYLKRRVGEVDDDPTYRARPVYKDKKVKSQQHCDGVDHIGCFVVRLYYDWFLVNGSCKCWKPSPKRVLTGR